jgi:precorrin-6Y C5,15-methyltransferase (decarboxylating)
VLADHTDLVTVVGIGAGGWSDLSRTGRSSLLAAPVLFGSDRQLALIPPEVTAVRVAWPSPLLPALPGLFAAHPGPGVCVLASGDPMFHGIGATLVRLLGADRVRVLPHPGHPGRPADPAPGHQNGAHRRRSGRLAEGEIRPRITPSRDAR